MPLTINTLTYSAKSLSSKDLLPSRLSCSTLSSSFGSPISVKPTNFPVDRLNTNPDLLLISSKTNDTFFCNSLSSARWESSISFSIMSRLNPLSASVKLIYFFNVFTCGKHKNLFLLLAICLYAAGEVWYILKHQRMIRLI